MLSLAIFAQFDQSSAYGNCSRGDKHETQLSNTDFVGHMFCADCGSKLYYIKPPKQAENYCRAGYRKHKFCTGHHIRVDIVEQLLIKQINSVMDYVSEFEEEFTRQTVEKATEDQCLF